MNVCVSMCVRVYVSEEVRRGEYESVGLFAHVSPGALCACVGVCACVLDLWVGRPAPLPVACALRHVEPKGEGLGHVQG